MWFSSNHYKNQRLNFEENQRANLLFRERALSNFMFMGKLKAEGFIIMGGLFRTSRVYNMQMCLMFFILFERDSSKVYFSKLHNYCYGKSLNISRERLESVQYYFLKML